MSLLEEFNKIKEYFKKSDHEYLQRHPYNRKIHSIEIVDGCFYINTGISSILVENSMKIEEALDILLLDELKREEYRKTLEYKAKDSGYTATCNGVTISYTKYQELHEKGLL